MSLGCALLLAVTWVAELLEFCVSRLAVRPVAWLGREAGLASIWLSRQHSAAWKKKREDERFERIQQER